MEYRREHVDTNDGRKEAAGLFVDHIQGSHPLAGGQPKLPQMPTVEETVIATGSPKMKALMDGGLLGAIEYGFVVSGIEQDRAMAAGSAPRLAASIGMHVFDGLLSKACPSRPVGERAIEPSLHPGYGWQFRFCTDVSMSRQRPYTNEECVRVDACWCVCDREEK